MPPTMKQVARLAKVSPATVSLVLNEKGSISEQTRAEVKRIIRESGYKRRPSGRTVGLIGHVPPHLAKTLQFAAAEYGYDTEVLFTDPPTDGFRWDDGIGGTIIYGGRWKADVLGALTDACPSVLLGGHTRRPCVDSIWVDNADSMDLALTYLVDRGHRHVGFVNGPQDTPTSWEKDAGFQYAVMQMAVGLQTAVVHSASFAPEHACAAAADLLTSFPAVTALIVAEVRMAEPINTFLQQRGLAVPDDVSLIIFRDAAHLETTAPPLTAIGFSYLDMSREAITQLVRRINEPTVSGKRTLLRPHMVERGSVLSL